MTRMSRMRACRCGHSRERNAPDREGASSRQMFGRHRKGYRYRIVERGGPVFFGSYAGRRAGRLRIGYPATPAAGGRPHRGIRRMMECRKPLRRFGPVRVGRHPPGSFPGNGRGASGRRRKPYDRQLRVSGGESANAPAEGATAGTVPPFVRRDQNTLSTARADNTSSRNESRPFRNPPRRGGMPSAGVAYRGAA